MTIKLLVVTTVASTCTAFLRPFAVHFRRKGWQVDALAHGAPSDTQCVEAFNNTIDVSWTRNPWSIIALRKTLAEVKKCIMNGQYDIVHVHTPIAALITRFVISRIDSANRPLAVYTAHGFHFFQGNNFFSNMIFKTLELAASKWTDALITINKEDYNSAKHLALAKNGNIYHIPGIGISTTQYSTNSDKKALLEELKLPKNSLLLLSIAEFTSNKRHIDQLKALQLLSKKHVHLLFAGTGKLLPAIQKTALTLGIEKQVHFMGFRRDIPRLINSTDALILTSKREGLPRSILEAFAAGTPVIGTRTRGTLDLLQDDCGLLVDVGSQKQIKEAIEKILDNEVLRKKLITNGYNKLQNYTIENVISKQEAIYARALEQRLKKSQF